MGRAGSYSEPITADQPCGENLEDSPLLASFDAFRLFGRTKPLDAVVGLRREEAEDTRGSRRAPAGMGGDQEQVARGTRQEQGPAPAGAPGDRVAEDRWTPRVRRDAHDRVSRGSRRYWAETYPLVDEDGILRRSALNCFADPIAVVDGLRRAPLVSSRQHGPFSLRDIDIATGHVARRQRRRPAGRGAGQCGLWRRCRSRISPGFRQGIGRALTSLKNIDAKMRDGDRDRGDARLRRPCRRSSQKLDQVLRAQLAARPSRRRPGADGAATRRVAARRRWARSDRARMPSVRSTRSPTSFAGPSRRARFRCSASVRSVWCRRTFSKCWPTSRPRP